MSNLNLGPGEVQVRPVVTSRINKVPMVKVLLYPRKDAVERRLDSDYGIGKWSWYVSAPGVWTLEAGSSKQSVPEDPVEATSYTVNVYNKILFVRAARNLGYGRELETLPPINIFQDDVGSYNFTPGKDRWIFQEYLSVKAIESKDGIITKLEIVRDKDGKTVFSYGKTETEKAVEATEVVSAQTSTPAVEKKKRPKKEPAPIVQEVALDPALSISPAKAEVPAEPVSEEPVATPVQTSATEEPEQKELEDYLSELAEVL